jgi:hypothetical protein
LTETATGYGESDVGGGRRTRRFPLRRVYAYASLAAKIRRKPHT